MTCGYGCCNVILVGLNSVPLTVMFLRSCMLGAVADVLDFSFLYKGIKFHSEHFLEVFCELQRVGLNIGIGNCNFSLKSLEYLGI